jgi:NADPH:quinone reductase-like Zn-dependent oxidoreductase
MKAVVLRGAFGIEHLQVENRQEAPLQPNDVRVKLHAASLNYRDYLTVIGAYNPKQPLPLIPLSDGAGEIIEVGAAVTQVKVGTRVTSLFAQAWQSGAPTKTKLRSTLGGPLDGVLAETAVLPETGVVTFPDYLSYAEAATVPCAALTAWNALEQSNLQAGQTVLIQGTGGVSLFALQFAKQRGAKVVVTSKSDAKLERCKALGADVGINYVQQPEWGRAARQVTGGDGVDVVVEVGGGGTLAQSVQCTKPGGTIALIGVLAGVKSELQLTPILMQNIRIQGVMVGHREQQEAMQRAMQLAQLRPVVDHAKFGMDTARAAFQHMASGEHFGKIVLDI